MWAREASGAPRNTDVAAVTKAAVPGGSLCRFSAGESPASPGVSASKPWPGQSDEQLLAEYAARETPAAFEELVRRYERPLYAYLRKRLGDANLAEDAFQATFLEVYRRRQQFDPARPVRAWVYRIAATRAIDLTRRNRRHKLISLDARPARDSDHDDPHMPANLPDHRAPSPPLQVEMAEDKQWLQRLVCSLPTRLRDVLVLIMLREHGYQEAADILRIPLGTVKSRMHEALRRLRTKVTAA
jgi:RNA polymerase sigma-70 factor, ECF subfamily